MFITFQKKTKDTNTHVHVARVKMNVNEKLFLLYARVCSYTSTQHKAKSEYE